MDERREKVRVPCWCQHCENTFGKEDQILWLREFSAYVHLECLMPFAEENCNDLDRLRMFAVYRHFKRLERLS